MFELGDDPSSERIEVPSGVFQEGEEYESAFELLGYRATLAKSRMLLIKEREVPKRFARIRRDGAAIIFAVKEKRKEGVEIDERPEEEVRVVDAGALEYLLVHIGYALEDLREKYRTTYRFDDAVVEINQWPKGPPWMEVEAPTPARVYAAVEKLGYTKDDTASMSDKKFYKMHGVSREELRFFRFPK